MITSKPLTGAGAAPVAAQSEPSEFQGGVGGLYIVSGNDYRQVGTVAHWKMIYEESQSELLGSWQRIEIEAEHLWLVELPQSVLNILLFRKNLVYVIARAYIEGIRGSESAEWQTAPCPWKEFTSGPWVIRSDLMVPPVPAMKCGTWDRAQEEYNHKKIVEILTLAEYWENLRLERRAKRGDAKV